MADVAALEKAAKDAAAKVREKETAFKATVGPADSAKQAYSGKKATKLAEKAKWESAKAAADKTAADGKAAVAKTADAKSAASKAYNAAKTATQNEYNVAAKATTTWKTAQAEADKTAAALTNAKKAAETAAATATRAKKIADDVAARAKNDKLSKPEADKKAAEAANYKAASEKAAAAVAPAKAAADNKAAAAATAKTSMDKLQSAHKAAKAKEDASKAAYDKAEAADKAAAVKAASDNKAASDKVNAAKAAYDKVNAEYLAASSDWSRKSDAKWAAYKALRDAEQTARTAGDTWAEAARKANIAQNVINATASGAKIIIGGVVGAASAALEAISNCSLLKGTKAGTAVDFSNCIVGVATLTLKEYAVNVGIDTMASLLSSIYNGKKVSEIAKTAFSAAGKSAKSPVTDIADKTMALLQAYDPDLTTDDLKDFSNALKENLVAMAKKLF
jgi:chemotaxis protein histidine kinase CheA